MLIHLKNIKLDYIVTKGTSLLLLLVLRLKPSLAAVLMEDMSAYGDARDDLLVHELVEADDAFLLVKGVHHRFLSFVKFDLF